MFFPLHQVHMEEGALEGGGEGEAITMKESSKSVCLKRKLLLQLCSGS